MTARAARQQMPAIVIGGRLQIERCAEVDAIAKTRLRRQRAALQRRTAHVLWRAVEARIALKHDEIRHAIAIGDDSRIEIDIAHAAMPIGAGFDVVRLLRHQRRI